MFKEESNFKLKLQLHAGEPGGAGGDAGGEPPAPAAGADAGGTNPPPAGGTPAPNDGGQGGQDNKGNGDDDKSGGKGGGTLTGNAKNEGENPDTNPTYDFKALIPEGMEFSQEESDKFVEVIKDMHLSSDQANSIVKYGMEWGQQIIKDIGEAMIAERKGWGEAAKQELGADFDKTMKLVGAGVEYVEKTIPGIRAALNETGAGNRIEIVKAFALLGQMLQEDPGKVNPGTGAPKKSSIYPNTDFGKYS